MVDRVSLLLYALIGAAVSSAAPFDPVGWAKSENLYYKCFTDVRHTYAEAEANCVSYGGRLAAKVLRDPVAVSDIISNGCLRDAYNNPPWVGFDDINTEGEWLWSNGGAMNIATTKWHPGQPNGGRVENCATTRRHVDGKIVLDDYPCERQFPCICEIEIPIPKPDVSTGWTKSANLFYKCFTDVRHTYTDAKESCESYGGRLAAKVLRDSVAVSDIVSNGCLRDAFNNPLWVGFDDIETEGQWRWSDGGTMSSSTTEWYPGQPNRVREENCANTRRHLNGKILLDDYPCERHFPYICEIETKTCETSPAEATATPVSTTMLVVPPGWEKSGNLFYKCFADVKVDYATAKSNCAAASASDGARLASKVLRDPVAVSNIIASGCAGSATPWIGFTDMEVEGEWKWFDGGITNNITTAWLPSQPDNHGYGEQCGHIRKVSDGRIMLNDNICSDKLTYICEVEN